MTEASVEILKILRSTDNLQWYVVPMIIFVAYIYLNEVEKGNRSAVLLGIFLWAGELIWEMINGLVLHFSQYAPLWATPGSTAFLIYVGINIEIMLFFSVGALLLIKCLPKDKHLKLLGVPNRLLIPVLGAFSAVIAEVVLNRCGMLVWSWRFWGWPHLYIIFINYCLPALGLVWLHDNLSLRSKRKVAYTTVVLAIICHIIFATSLGWI